MVKFSGRKKASRVPKSSDQEETRERSSSNVLQMKKISNEKEIVSTFPLFQSLPPSKQMSTPRYRNDELYYTPGFSLSDQFTPQYQYEQRQLHKQREKLQTNEIDVSDILQPRPSQRNSYCTICKIRFQDYKEHISLDQHQDKMKASRYLQMIKELPHFTLYSPPRPNVIKGEESLESVTCGNKQSLYQLVRSEYEELKPPKRQSIYEETIMDVIN